MSPRNIVAFVLTAAACAPKPPAPAPAPAAAGASSAFAHALAQADSRVRAAVAREQVPGAVLLVARDGRIVLERAYGYAQLYDYGMRRLERPVPMRTTDLFDLASVTKVMATTLAVMRLVDRGAVDVDAPVYRYLPEFRGAHLDSITVRHLLTHSAGLVQWQPLYYHAHTPRETYDLIRSMPLGWGVGEGRHYSDLGFMLLGYLVERVSGRPLDAFVRDELYRPLGLRHTTYLPRAQGFHEFAATEHGNPYERHMVYDTAFGYRYRGDPTAWDGWRRYTLVGEVDDGNAWYANGGVAGHAGLFSTAADLHILLEVLLNDGSWGGRRYLSPEVVHTFLTRDRYGHGLGWMMPAELPEGGFSHTGFTGTYVMGVPASHLAVVLLTNRQNVGTDPAGYYPDPGPLQRAVSRVLADAAAADAGTRTGAP
ncbi:MAG TPA: serine hydrolase [Longimicrobiales bacterium]|nr:serine hydrolase [Longimicrobiales bacterium]